MPWFVFQLLAVLFASLARRFDARVQHAGQVFAASGPTIDALEAEIEAELRDTCPDYIPAWM